ncbi:hypothetical protein N5852_00375 [Bartonella sp. HY328]|nr:hypothetical protein [Bartonella sp. HY328]UXN09476.1 hypothetical protein N5852_00375 [Bartonella sp. HY328]
MANNNENDNQSQQNGGALNPQQRRAIIGYDISFYEIYLEGNDLSLATIKQIASLYEVNFVKAKAILSKGKIFISKGHPLKIFFWLNKFHQLGLNYKIYPNFPYDPFLFADEDLSFHQKHWKLGDEPA